MASKKLYRRFNYDLVPVNSWVSKSKIPDAFQKQQELLASVSHPVIFDIGAHHGQTALEYQRVLPQATIYSFEPFKESFEILKDNTRAYPNIHPINLALGNGEAVKKLHINQFSATNSLLASHPEGGNTWGQNLLDTLEEVEVEVTTLDAFMRSRGINHVHLLKMDTQGYEFEVLQGAEAALSSGKIDLIYTEIITLPTYQEQHQLDEYLRYLRQRNYSLFNLYNLSYKKSGELRQVDALFRRNPSI